MKSVFRRGWKVLAIAIAIVLVPSAVWAVIGSFTSSNASPAVTGTNSSALANVIGVRGIASNTGVQVHYGVVGSAAGSHGIGVQGGGAYFGVFSNGNLGVAAGRSLTCSGCVSVADLSSAARGIQVLPSGASGSGMFSAGGGNSSAGGYLGAGITYPRPLATPIQNAHIIAVEGAPVTHCSGPGHADPGYLCLYDEIHSGVGTGYGYSTGFSAPSVGAVLYWPVTGNDPYSGGEYTVTAP